MVRLYCEISEYAEHWTAPEPSRQIPAWNSQHAMLCAILLCACWGGMAIGSSFLQINLLAWNTPSFTLSGWYIDWTFERKCSYNSFATSGRAAPWKSGLLPFFVEASSVNWDTESLNQHHTYSEIGVLHTTENLAFNILHAFFPLLRGQQAYRKKSTILRRTPAPVSSGQSFIFRTFAAINSTSFLVSPGPIAAKTSTPFPMDETIFWSTDTDPDSTRWSMAVHKGWMSIYVLRHYVHRGVATHLS